VGFGDGFIVGECNGAARFVELVKFVGELVGGDGVGGSVGDTVGTNVGISVVGKCVGGWGVGDRVGDCVGSRVGHAVFRGGTSAARYLT
jgi:hypothetical protein